MHWFGGSIAEAVTLSKQKNAIFVVFVEGDNDLSAEMAATIDEGTVVSRLSNPTNFLAVKLTSGSPNYTHFAQIYQFVPVPSLFFIGHNGTPLEVVCGGVQADSLAARIDRILTEHRKDTPTASSSQLDRPAEGSAISQPATVASANKKPASEDPTESTSAPAAKIQKVDHSEETEAQDLEVVCDGDVCVRRPKSETTAGTSQQPQVEPAPTDSAASIQEKMDRARELIEARQREKTEKEKQLQKEKEIERRSTGQGVAELKRWQADQEMKQLQEERKREKLENNIARQRILDQIAQDRAERRARDAPQVTPQVTPQTTQQTHPEETVPSTGDGGGRARIQFKLPDGASHTAHFDASDSTEVLRRYVADNLHMAPSSFALWTAFPRRALPAAGSLRALSLAPSAALLVLPAAAPPPAPSSKLFAYIVQLISSLILEPTQQVFSWLYARVWPPPQVAPAPATPAAPAPPSTPATPGGPLRRRGNIHKLPGDSKRDDDNNTWNGNSTQQM